MEYVNQQILCQQLGEETVSILKTKFSECPNEMCSLGTKEVILMQSWRWARDSWGWKGLPSLRGIPYG